MRFMIQRVKEASVTVEGQVVGKIGKGLLVFVGISNSDYMDKDHSIEGREEEYFNKEKALNIADRMVKKLIGMRIFEDENGKTNLDMKSVGGQLLIISQFTLYADCRKGNRPSFVNAGDPQRANDIYRYIIEKCRQEMEEEHSIEEYYAKDEHSMEKNHSMEKGHSIKQEQFVERKGFIKDGYSNRVVQEGIFGAEMEVALVNDGPFTIMLDSVDICK